MLRAPPGRSLCRAERLPPRLRPRVHILRDGLAGRCWCGLDVWNVGIFHAWSCIDDVRDYLEGACGAQVGDKQEDCGDGGWGKDREKGGMM